MQIYQLPTQFYLHKNSLISQKIYYNNAACATTERINLDKNLYKNHTFCLTVANVILSFCFFKTS